MVSLSVSQSGYVIAVLVTLSHIARILSILSISGMFLGRSSRSRSSWFKLRGRVFFTFIYTFYLYILSHITRILSILLISGMFLGSIKQKQNLLVQTSWK